MKHYYNITPIGKIDNTNTSFLLPRNHVIGTLEVYKNGLGESEHLIETKDNSFIIDEAPLHGDVITCNFIGEKI